MIIDFTIQNYLSIKDEISLSFLADKQIELPDFRTIPIENGKFNLFSFSAIYGPNASGKSNIIKGLSDLIEFILYSYKLDLDDQIPSYKPFRLDKANLQKPTKFEIEFVVDNKRYVFKTEFTGREIISEELYFFPEGRKATFYKREKNSIKFGNYFTGDKKSIETFLMPNRLLLSVAANSRNEVLQPVYRYFRDLITLHVRMDSSHRPFHKTTVELKKNTNNFKNKLNKLLLAADLSVKDIKLIEDEKISEGIRFPNDMPDDIKNRIINDLRFKPFLGHSIFDNGKVTENLEFFDLEDEESTGTIKMYDLAGEVLLTLQCGGVLIIDEFNSGLHPLLNMLVIELFINPDINKKNAQLLISTHDTCVLDQKIIKRQQIWFTDKDDHESTTLFSLDEFDKNLVRDNSKYGKMYLDGRFKAVPCLNFCDLVESLRS